MILGEFTLRPHQERAIAQARAEVARLLAAGLPPRVLVVAPCGAGKTIMSSALIAGAKAKERSSIFMASGRTLIYQKSRTLTKAGIHHAILMAGEEELWSNANVLVASKDTYAARALHGDKLSLERRDVWIVDEAHRAMSDEWMHILPQDDRTVVIGFTATPALNNGRGMGAYYKAMVQAATYSELLAAKLLVPCRVFAPWSVDTTGLKKTDGDWSWAQVALRAKKLTGKVVDCWKELGEGRPTACFAQGVEHSIGLRDEFNAAGIPAAHIDKDTSTEDRDAIFADVRAGRTKVVCNFGVLTVGWDEPCVSCAILNYATESLVKHLQVAGRVLRTFPGKADALVIDHGDNVRRHGWPTDDHEWSLDPEEKISVRDPKARAEKGVREPICCPHCGAMRSSGPTCINCGHQHVRSGIKVYNEHGELKEIRPKQAKEQRGNDALQKVWMRCLAIAAANHLTFWSAKAIFRKRTGQKPDGLKPMPETHKLSMDVGVVYPGFVRRKAAS